MHLLFHIYRLCFQRGHVIVMSLFQFSAHRLFWKPTNKKVNKRVVKQFSELDEILLLRINTYLVVKSTSWHIFCSFLIENTNWLLMSIKFTYQLYITVVFKGVINTYPQSLLTTLGSTPSLLPTIWFSPTFHEIHILQLPLVF